MININEMLQMDIICDQTETEHQEKQEECYTKDTLEDLYFMISSFAGVLFNATEKPSEEKAYALDRARRALPRAVAELARRVALGALAVDYDDESTHDEHVHLFPTVDGTQLTGLTLLVAIPSNSAKVYRAEVSPQGLITQQNEIATYGTLDQAIKQMDTTKNFYSHNVDN